MPTICLSSLSIQVTSALLKGSLEEDEAALAIEGGDEGTLAAVTASLSYLRDRVRQDIRTFNKFQYAQPRVFIICEVV